MKKIILFAGLLGVVILMPLTAFGISSQASKEKMIPQGPKAKVLLLKEASSALMEAKGAYRVISRSDGVILSSGSVGKRFVVHAIQEGLRWGEEYPDIYRFSVVPIASDTMLYVNGIQYKGTISVYHHPNNRISIVNEVPVEEVVKSSLCLQETKGLLPAAVDALAITTRSEIFDRLHQDRAGRILWHVTADEIGYFGHAATHQKNGVEEAVERTRFMVLDARGVCGDHGMSPYSMQKIQELAEKGLDAQKILKNLFPQSKLGITIHPDEVAIR